MPKIPPWPEFGIHVLVKPIGPLCNLRCRYCFYLEKESLYTAGESWRMSEETLEVYIRQYAEATPAAAQDIHFTFQGGEPTLMGLDFFRLGGTDEMVYTIVCHWLCQCRFRIFSGESPFR
jgi:sulfatase maturation enzyme AslB (radical SAM superfamily)